jgi:hypothetical protein
VDAKSNQKLYAAIGPGKRPHLPSLLSPALQQLSTACWHHEAKKRPTFRKIVAALQHVQQEGPPKIHLSLDNACLFCKATTVFAYRSTDQVVIFKDWGKNVGNPGCFVVQRENQDVLCCEPSVFHSTYDVVGDPQRHEYRKVGHVLARCMEDRFAIKTPSGVEFGDAGDYMLQDEQGDQWAVPAAKFLSMYTKEEEE